MANRYDIAHRFANKQEGKRGSLTAGNVRYEGRSYYSYSTVFGQWLDMSKNVVCVFDGSTSISSSKHKLHKGIFPDDVHVFPLDFSGGYYGWNNCELVSRYASKDEDFTFNHRMQMIDYYVGRIYNRFSYIKESNAKGRENVSFMDWEYIEELCSLYRDTSIPKYYRWTKNHEYKQLVRALNEGVRDVQAITDYLFGDGTYEAYMARTEKFRKAERTKEKITALAHRLGIQSPYESEWGSEYMPTELKAADIRKLNAKERLEIHWKSLNYAENIVKEQERKKKHYASMYNAFQFVTGYKAQETSIWDREPKSPTKVRNRFTGEEYNLKGTYYRTVYWCKSAVVFNYDEFRTAPHKDDWIRDFYIRCEEVADNLAALSILEHIGAHCKEKEHWYDDNQYIDDNFLKENTTPAQYAICADFIKRQDKHFADIEAQRRAREIARLKAEEEERKEREHLAQVKAEQIEECKKDGIEGARNLWRKHLMSFNDARCEANGADEFYNGGNVLLRLNLAGDTIETSKNIRIPVAIAKRYWAVVQKWHENPETFSPREIDTKGSGKYTIASYDDDVLTAGCHKISYAEMENVMNKLN